MRLNLWTPALRQHFLKTCLILSGCVWQASCRIKRSTEGLNTTENGVRSWRLPIWSLAQVWRKREGTEREVDLDNNKQTGGKLRGATVAAKMRPSLKSLQVLFGDASSCACYLSWKKVSGDTPPDFFFFFFQNVCEFLFSKCWFKGRKQRESGVE